MKKLLCLLLVCFTLTACSANALPELKYSDLKDSDGIHFTGLDWNSSKETVETYFGLTETEVIESTETSETVVARMFIPEFDMEADVEFLYANWVTDDKGLILVRATFDVMSMEKSEAFYDDYFAMVDEIAKTNTLFENYFKTEGTGYDQLISPPVTIGDKAFEEEMVLSMLLLDENEEEVQVMIDIGLRAPK